MKLIATIISRIFEPFIVLPVITIIGAYRAGFVGAELISFTLILVLVMIAPAVLFFLWLLHKGHIKDWDIHNRKERLVPLGILILLVALDRVLVAGFHHPKLTDVFTVYLIWICGFSLVTLWYKISGHVGLTALATGLFILWYGMGWWPLLLFVPLVAWARLVRHDHTLGQVLLGASYSWAVVIIASLM